MLDTIHPPPSLQYHPLDFLGLWMLFLTGEDGCEVVRS
jgi:hypothetical protein